MQSKDFKQEDVLFKPLNSGLGFHPFSDGLPYAPVSKADTSIKGIGATLAGTPKFVFDSQIRLKLNPIKADLPAVLAAPPIVIVPVPRFSMTRRFFSYAIDLIIHNTLGLFSLWVFLFSPNPELYMPDSVEFWATIVSFCFILHFGLMLAQESIIQCTFGKRLMGLRLLGAPRAIIKRSILFLPSALIVGLGLLIGLFRKDRSCWHDLASGVRVINLRS